MPGQPCVKGGRECAWELSALPLSAFAQAPATTPRGSHTTTQSGQPIVAPQGPLQVNVAETVVPVGGKLPVHRHAYTRYVYVLEGRAKVINLDTGHETLVEAGELIVEPLEQWHSGESLGPEPLRLIGIDQTPPGAANFIRRDP